MQVSDQVHRFADRPPRTSPHGILKLIRNPLGRLQDLSSRHPAHVRVMTDQYKDVMYTSPGSGAGGPGAKTSARKVQGGSLVFRVN